MTDKDFKIDKDEYDRLKQAETDKIALESQIATFKAEKVQGKAKWLETMTEMDELKTEKEDLFTQLVPVWNEQGEQKLAMVNSILETIPEAERDAKKVELEKLDHVGLGVIVNSLPPAGTPGQHGVVTNGGMGSGRTPTTSDNVVFEDPEKQAQYEAAQNLPKTNSRIGIIKKAEEAE